MPRQINKLTPLKVGQIKRRGLHADGGGLYLQVSMWGTKSWLFRYMRFGRRHQMGLGPIHTVSLHEARVRARQHRQTILNGKDPLGAKRDAIVAEKIAAAKQVTFRQCAEDFLRISPVAKAWTNDTHRKQWRQTLEDYAYPILGDVPVGQIDVALIKRTLTPVWEDMPVTASRLRGRIELVLAYATASRSERRR